MPRSLPTSLYALLLIVLVEANFFLYSTLFAPKELSVAVLDVGKGSAVLLRTPSGATLLIDAGPDASILRALGEALPMWERRIDAVALTAAAGAAAGGLPEVASRYHTSAPVRFGTADTPYGTSIAFNGASITILAPATLTIHYGSASLNISSTTPKGVYRSEGKTMTKVR